MHKYASASSEARELVAELEFVWDQIKSNSATSSNSSPAQIRGLPSPSSPSQQPQFPSYTSIRPGRPRKPNNGRLKVLGPTRDDYDSSDTDADEILAEAQDRRRRGSFDPNAEAIIDPDRETSFLEKAYEIRNRKWRKRIESTLMKMMTEIAALREQLEAKGVGAQHFNKNPSRRRKLWAWTMALVAAAARHIFIDAMAIILLLWINRGDERIKSVMRMFAEVVRERLRRVGLLRRLEGFGKGFV